MNQFYVQNATWLLENQWVIETCPLIISVKLSIWL